MAGCLHIGFPPDRQLGLWLGWWRRDPTPSLCQWSACCILTMAPTGGGGSFPKPQMELKAQRGQAASQGHTELGRQSCGANFSLWVQHRLA